MKRWLVTMGDYHSCRGVVVEVVWVRGSLSASLLTVHEPPASLRVAGKGFTGARVLDDRVYICGFNAVYRFTPRTGHMRTWLARHDFNDLHDLELECVEGQLRSVLIANTGHDSIDRCDARGVLVSRVQLAEPRADTGIAQNDPYFPDIPHDTPFHLRRVRDAVHPNAVRVCDTHIWISRFADRSLECQERGLRRTVPVDGHPHDLVFDKDELWFTTTEGCVWALAFRSPDAVPRLVVDTYTATGLSGWCRGLSVDDGHLLVGLTRMVPSSTKRWCARTVDDTVTALVLLERKTLRPLGAIELEAFGQHAKVFSINRFDTGQVVSGAAQ